MFKIFAACYALGLVFTSCKKEDQALTDRNLILADIAKKGVTALEDLSGVFYTITTQGTGGSPMVKNTVKVFYSGYYLDGFGFDATSGTPIEFPLTNVIEGWQIAVPLLQKQGAGTFWIPSQLAYGSNPPQGIRKDAVLVFDIVLQDFY
jgi:FKBP-type peptidyl-prolyl cis-trans isomerase FkpA